MIGQIRSGSWSDDGKSWIAHYENLSDIQVSGNIFSSNKANGEFVTYDTGTKTLKGLKITNPWSTIPEKQQWEIGLRNGNLEEFLYGKFTQASLRPLDKGELTKLDKSDLRIMRNEIFARYGLKFKTDGDMDRYFKKQNWYHEQHDNVDRFLTELEKDNIKLIQDVESR